MVHQGVIGEAAESSAQQNAMNTPMTAANTMARNEPVPAVAMMAGTMMKTDEAGVTEDRVMNTFPSGLISRTNSCSYRLPSAA